VVAVHALWRHAASDPPLMHELLGVAANLLAGCAAAKVGQCMLKPAETRIETELISEIGEAPYASIFPYPDKWRRSPMHHSALDTICDILLASHAFDYILCRYTMAAAVEDEDGGDGGRPASLADRLLKLAFRNTSPVATTRLALAPLASLAGDPASRRWLLRSPFLSKAGAYTRFGSK